MNSLVAFEAVCRHSSFIGAAEELALSQSTVSYRIKHLEETIGVVLFQRLTRQIKLTPAGQKFLVTVNESLKTMKSAIEQLNGANRLTVTLSTYLASRWLSPRLSNWSTVSGNVRIELNHDFGKTAVQSDISIHWTTDLREQEAENTLFKTYMTPYCTPEIAAQLERPGDILSFPLLAAEPKLDVWQDWFNAAGISPARDTEFITMPDSNVRIRAAADGVGITLGNHLTSIDMTDGRMVQPFDIHVDGPGFYVSKHPSASVVADDFIAWLKQQQV